jgi:N-methylhydantoinase B
MATFGCTRRRTATTPTALPQMLDSIPGDNEPISWGVFPLMGDDALYVCWNGGGGIGDPLDRPPEKVTADLVAGLISKEAAGESVRRGRE